MSLCLDKRVETELRALSGNNICCDCDAKQPQWASVSFGIFMCLECSGRHRALGVHISFVRSVTMDSWSEKQIQMMRSGGNDKFNSFLASHNIRKNMQIALKYNTPAALFYREKLNAEVNGLPPPTKFPEASNTSAQSTTPNSTEPLPGESEADYVARQRRLQEEARERMRQKFGNSSGLSSSGKMQGIGSDPNYRTGSGGGGNGNDWPVDVNQIADVSSKAFSYFSSTLSVLGEQVVKTTQQLIDEPKSGAPSGNGSSRSGSTAPSPNEPDVWSSLATGAASWWQKASSVTSDIIQSINAPEEEDMRFPRPPTNNTSASNNNSSHSVKSQPPQAGPRDPSPINDSNILKDQEEIRRSQQYTSNPPRKAGIADLNEEEFNNSVSISGKNRLKETQSPSPVILSRNSSGMSLEGGLISPPRSNGGNPSSEKIAVRKTSTPTPAASTSSKKEAPVGEDFFATFGV